MLYQLLRCGSSTCRMNAFSVPCGWRGRVKMCELAGQTEVNQLGYHMSITSSPTRGKLTKRQKEKCREMAGDRFKPNRIRNTLMGDYEPGEVPDLKVVQNFVNYYAKTQLSNNDKYGTINKWVKSTAYKGTEAESQAFSFSWHVDSDGMPILGTGHDDHPLIVGVTSKQLLRRLDRDPSTFVLHIDKLTHVGYSVIVIGISDQSRHFHLVALFVVSRHRESEYAMILAALCRIYKMVTGKLILLRHVLGDADQAQFNAIKRVFGDPAEEGYQYLMCFFHVMVKVQDCNNWSPDSFKIAVKDVYDMHFASSRDEYFNIATRVLANWKNYSVELAEFARYFEKEWMRGDFIRWQSFHTPPGFATTNSPVEQFSAKIKRDYTMRKRLKVGTLLGQIAKCCLDEAINGPKFAESVGSNAALETRWKELEALGLLCESEDAPRCAGLVCVVAEPAPRVYIPSIKRKVEAEITALAQMGEHYSRMETEGQVDGYWRVDLVNRRCPCRYFFKFGICVHILFALDLRHRFNSLDNVSIANRGFSKRKRDSRDLSEASSFHFRDVPPPPPVDRYGVSERTVNSRVERYPVPLAFHGMPPDSFTPQSSTYAPPQYPFPSFEDPQAAFPHQQPTFHYVQSPFQNPQTMFQYVQPPLQYQQPAHSTAQTYYIPPGRPSGIERARDVL